MHLNELKSKNPSDLLSYAESLEVENLGLRKTRHDVCLFKKLAENDVSIYGEGVLEVLADGFGFLRSVDSNYLQVLMIFMFRQVRLKNLVYK